MKFPEAEYVAMKLVEKVWQGDMTKYGLAFNCATVAIAALQDYTHQEHIKWIEEKAKEHGKT